ncbi:MAG TPA: DNA mismatch repair endonuclease MutL [Myxococcaceae bacterium]|nr:DNA mismatch repair endonuclease MutL [Myxococcaceae bacterium]
MAQIAVLSEELINKIAAGEVVERPASVVKELCENSLDAGARTLRVALDGGGLRLVSITDDGKGMSREDAELCLIRHATSKLRDLEGLFSIHTMGFRGEAIPAIASVSRFTLTTSEPGARVGTRVHVEGGAPAELEDAPAMGGTVIRVEDLFFNTPARRKFLRREQTELGHCEEAVIRLALANPDVGFFVEHAGRKLLQSPACPDDPSERIAAALGQEVHPHLLPVEERVLGVTVTGYVASPEYTQATARGIYTFVNRRYIRDRGLNHAIQRAFQESLPGGRQPVAVLFIEIDPRAVDVNVHPQKLEVRFADSRGVYDAVFAGVSRAVRGSPYVNVDVKGGAQPATPQYAMAVEQFLSRAQQSYAQQAHWGGPLPMVAEASRFVPPDGRAPAFGEARPGINQAPPEGYFSSLEVMGTLSKRFWICEAPGGTLVVLDPHAAFERARLAAYRKAFEKGASQTTPQRFLFASTVELSVSEAKVILNRGAQLERLGFEVEPFGGTTVALKAVPPGLHGAEDYRPLFSDLAVALPPPGSAETLAAYGDALKVLACHAAKLHAERELTHGEQRALFAELDKADFHPPCLHGNVVVHELPLLELERKSRG